MLILFSAVLLRTKSEGRKQWLLIFRHNSSTGQYFTSDELFYHAKDEFRYSIFGEIDYKSYKISRFYEFHLIYHDVDPNKRIQFSQNYFPTEIEPSKNLSILTCKVTKFELPNPESSAFHCLTMSVNPIDTYMDCEHDGFWYSLGAKKHYSTYTNTFAGIRSLNLPVQNVELWMRIFEVVCTVVPNQLCKSSLSQYILVVLLI